MTGPLGRGAHLGGAGAAVGRAADAAGTGGRAELVADGGGGHVRARVEVDAIGVHGEAKRSLLTWRKLQVRWDKERDRSAHRGDG